MEILQFVWDPTSEGITIFGKFTIYYYSLMWMLAFILGFYIMQIIYKKEGLSMEKLDSLFVYTILGTINLLTHRRTKKSPNKYPVFLIFSVLQYI